MRIVIVLLLIDVLVGLTGEGLFRLLYILGKLLGVGSLTSKGVGSCDIYKISFDNKRCL